MASDIKCVVEECVYNAHAKCEAPAIEVSSCGDKVVTSADKTECSTFSRG